MMSRRGFLSSIGGTLAVLGLAGCSGRENGNVATGGSNGSAASGSSSVVGGVETDMTTSEIGSAEAKTAEEAGTVESDDGLREIVQMDQPDWSQGDYSHVSPDPADVQGTVLTASPAPNQQQRLFLWEEGKAPAATSDNGSGHDPQGFRPTVTSVPVASGVDVKGAVLLCAGGAFAVRGDNSDCYPTARVLARRGYQCFVVDYRLHPYTQAESGLDLARAIRFVRAHWQEFGLPSERHIAVGGYSAGGILCGETILNQGGSHSPAEVDSSYVPDELDAVDATAYADAMLYSFYGRLSVAEKSADVLHGGNCPPTYFCYGTEDPFYDQFEGQVDLMNSLGYTVRARVLDGWPHGFGAEGGWIPEFDDFMQDAFVMAAEGRRAWRLAPCSRAAS